MTEAELLEAVKAKAIALWGEKYWKSELTHAYYPIALGWTTAEQSTAEFRNHRPTIQRIYSEGGGTRISTLVMLASAVGMKVTIN